MPTDAQRLPPTQEDKTTFSWLVTLNAVGGALCKPDLANDAPSSSVF